MKKNVLVFGLISGFVVSVIMGFNMIMMSKDPNADHGTGTMMIGYLIMLISLSLIFVAVKNYRDKQNDGVVSFGKAFKMGLLITLIASTMYVIMWALVYNLYMPDFMDKYAESMIKKARPEELRNVTAEAQKFKEMYKNPVYFILLTYTEILPVGLIVSLISALILKRKKAVVV
jgi:heme/copper-type cytochrome/quinol oxidase subunit 2